MVRSVFHRFLVLAAALGLTLAVGIVWGQNPGAIPVPISIGAHASIPSGLQSTVTFDARGGPGAANAGYYSRPVLISKNTLGGLANGLIRRALPVAAMIAAVEAAGWVIDELTKQVMIPGQAEGLTEGQAAWCLRDGNPPEPLMRCRLTPESWVGYQPTHPSFQFPIVSVAYGGNSGSVSDFEGRSLSITAMPYSPSSHVDATPNSQPTPVPLADLGQLVQDNPSLWNDALRNPDGSVNRNPDVMAAANALAAELAANAPAPDPTAEWDTGLQGGDPNASPTALEFPAFCAWASRMCELADWLQDDTAPPDDDPTVEEIPLVLDQSWSSGFGGGSCPAPVQISVLNTDVSFSYQPLCDVAVYIKPIVLAGTALLCVFIIAGFRRAT